VGYISSSNQNTENSCGGLFSFDKPFKMMYHAYKNSTIHLPDIWNMVLYIEYLKLVSGEIIPRSRIQGNRTQKEVVPGYDFFFLGRSRIQ
jgi:hypothetical protein